MSTKRISAGTKKTTKTKTCIKKKKGKKIKCACGCGILINPIGYDGKPKQYATGHNHRTRKTRFLRATQTTKTCNKCEENKPVEEFFWVSKPKKQRHGTCKVCLKSQREAKKKTLKMIKCACGCGKKVNAIDLNGRPHRYKVGHSTRKTRICKKTKQCSLCKKMKRMESFSRSKSYESGRASRCKQCYKEMRTEQRQDPKLVAKMRKNGLKSTKARRKALQLIILRYLKEHGCIDCGENDPVVLEFDHIDQGTKEDTVSHMVHTKRPLEVIMKEIAKCEVRCANCHRRKTAIQCGWYPDIDLSTI